MNTDSKVQTEKEILIPTTVRFTQDTIDVLDALAVRNRRSRADIIRYTVDKRLPSYISPLFFVQPSDAIVFHEDIFKLLNVMEDIRSELNRIGVNYNQELRLKNIEQKYTGKNDLASIQMRLDEESAIKGDISLLSKDELDKIMERYDHATDKVGDVLCHIRL